MKKSEMPMTHPQQQLIREVIAEMDDRAYISTFVSRWADKLHAALSAGAVPQQELQDFDWGNLRTVLCDVSQIFNGWRPWEEWSEWDEEVAQAVVAIQRSIDVPAVSVARTPLDVTPHGPTLREAQAAIADIRASGLAGAVPQQELQEPPHWLLAKLRFALDEARRTISVDHPVREHIEAAMTDITYFELMNHKQEEEEDGAVPALPAPQEQEPDFEFGLCSVCHGNGVLKIPRGVMTCARCDGSGREMRRK